MINHVINYLQNKIGHNTTQNTVLKKNNINSYLIKKLSPETRKCLLDLYNRIWEEGIILKNWKTSITIILLKEGVYKARKRPTSNVKQCRV